MLARDWLLRLSIGVLGLMTVLDCASASNWPRFRGPNGAGIASDKDIPVQWKEDDGILWKTRLPGLGNSSPVVWGDRIFVQSATEDGKERMLLCLDAPTGKVLWSRSAPGGMAKTHRKNSLASSTPATDGERVFAIFWDGVGIALHCYDFTGKLLWSKSLGNFTSQHGAGMSPITHDGLVIVNNDQDGTASILALDAKTGDKVWQSQRPAFRTCYSTPFILEKPGTPPELIVGSTAGITSYEPRSGKENWSWTWTFAKMPLRTVASPVAGHGLIFANSGDGAGDRHAVAVKAEGKGDVSSTNLAWESRRVFSYVPCMLVWGDHLFFVNDLGIAACHVAKTGENVWTERLGGNVSASPVLIDGKIYAFTEEGDAVIYNAGPKFEQLAKNSMGEPVIATPAVANDRLYVRGKSHLFCIGKPSKK